ncbi:MAG: thioredoxin-dependent thiol peroxidase [Oligoflexales bacterium]
MMPKPGDAAPSFSLKTDTNDTLSLQSCKGKKVVLFFYPKDDTPGCTKESCEFRDLAGEFDKKGAIVLGISPDGTDSHKAFKSKFALNFPLLVDTEHKIADAYGVWGEQEWQGKKYMGIARTTFVIDAQGKIAKVYANVNPVGHANQVLNDVGNV